MTSRLLLCGLLFLAIACGQVENTWNVTGFQKSDVSSTGAFVIYWMIEPNGKNITIGIEVQTTNWVGFGISPNPNQPAMIGSDAFVGNVNNGVVTGADYYLSAQQVCTAADGVCADAANGHQNNIEVLYGEETGGVTRIKFRRPVAASDPAPYDVAIPDGPIGFVAAIGSAAAITSHSVRFSGGINFYTGIATAAPDTTDMRVAHGFLMFFAWGVILPVGSGIARWAKKFGWWFNVHRLLQSLGVLISVAAFVLAVEFSTSHFDTNHKIIGLTVLCLALIQPPLGILADKWFSLDRDSTPVFPDYVHWIFGWSAVILGLINTAIGLYVYLGSYTALVIAYIAWAVLVTLVLGVVAIVMAIKYRGENSH